MMDKLRAMMKGSDIKQAIVVRSDLQLGKGKLAGQVAHAAVAGYRKVLQKDRDVADTWEREGEKKVVLKVASESEMLQLYERAKREVPCVLIHDAGLTQIEPGTATCFSLGPWHADEIDKFTKGLKLL